MGMSMSLPAAQPAGVTPEQARRAMPRAALGDVWLVYHCITGPALDLTYTRVVSTALRAAMMCRAPQPPLEILSGHTPDGRASRRHHIAFVALPSLQRTSRPGEGDAWTVGSLAGVALLVPRELDDRERRHIEATVAPPRPRPLSLAMGRAGCWRLAPTLLTPPDPGLRPDTWLGPARRWCTVTPIALDRFPGRMYSADAGARERAHAQAAEIIARSCSNIGLPAPARVRVGPDASLDGVPGNARFPRFQAGSRPRLLVHAEIVFATPVSGPVLVGAGRYAGLGLCLPSDTPPPERRP